MKTVKQTAVAVALGTVVVGSAFTVNAQTNPFGFEAMDAGYQIVGSEGKCGEAKCGEDMKKAAAEKAKEGKCGAEMKAAADKAKEGSCGAQMKAAADKAKEGSCGADMKKAADKMQEGKCGGEMKKAADKVEAKTDAVKKEVK
ncbi:hypothetical protein L9G16_10325 [Shewanella sp. A25]|nr:hypothetical protein [Shewanella shenzhenensis]